MPKHYSGLSSMKLFQPVTPAPYDGEIARIGQLSTELQKQMYCLESLLLCTAQEHDARDSPDRYHTDEAGTEMPQDSIKACVDKTTYARYEDLRFLSATAHQRAAEMVNGQWMTSTSCPDSLILFLPKHKEPLLKQTLSRTDGKNGHANKPMKLSMHSFTEISVNKAFAAFEYSSKDFVDIQLMLDFLAREITKLASDIKCARKFVRDLLYWQHSTS